jgi:hypothetical protein
MYRLSMICSCRSTAIIGQKAHERVPGDGNNFDFERYFANDDDASASG